VRARALLAALAVALGGCSLVFDSGRHTEGGGADAGGGMDAGPRADAGEDPVDAGDAPTDAGDPTPDAGDDPDAGPADGGDVGRVPVTEFCAMYVDSVCNGVRDCCSRVPEPPEEWDQTMCRATVGDQCGTVVGLVLSRDYLQWDEEAAFRALMQGQAFIDDDCNPNLQDWLVDLDGFFSPVQGTRAAGAECTPSDPSNATEVLASVLSCQDGSRCIRGGGRWSCVAPSALGDPCSFAFDCADAGARCAGGLFNKTCQIPGEAVGTACLLPDECQSLICTRARCQPVTQDAIYCQENVGVPPPP